MIAPLQLELNFVFLGGPAVEETVNSEVTEDGEPEHRGRDVTDADVDNADEPQPGLHDTESLSSGSSIELLDTSDDVQDHAAVETPAPDDVLDGQSSAEVATDKEDEKVVMSGGSDASESAVSSSSDRFNSAVRAESLIYDGGEVESVSAAGKSVTDSASDAVDTAVYKTPERAADDNDDEDEGKARVTEAEMADECQQMQDEVQPQQSAALSSSTDRTVLLETYGNDVDETQRFVVFYHNVTEMVINSTSTWGRARSVHDHFGTSCVPTSVHRYKLLRYMSRTVSEHRVIRLRYTYRSEYGQFRYIHFGTL